ncbi:hypothetical protein ACFLQX_00700 [Bacteroidota bacterium]
MQNSSAQHELQDRYSQRKEKFEQDLKKQNRSLGYIGFLRLIVAILAVYILVLGIREYKLLFVVSGLMVILFFVLVSYHKNQSDKKKLLQKLVSLNKNELSCLDHSFTDNQSGSEFISSDHPWSFDLDLFGEGSIYQYINRTSTHGGADSLAAYLDQIPKDQIEIAERQNILQELSPMLDLRQLFIARAGMFKKDKDEVQELLEWVKQSSYIQKHPWLKFVSIGMSVISLLIIIAGFFDPGLFGYLLPVLFINWFFLSPFLVKTNRYHEQVSKKHSFLSTYAELMLILSGQEFSHRKLQDIQLLSKAGCSSIKRLSKLLGMFDQRLNLLMGVLMNSLFLFDFHMLRLLSKWTNQHSEELGKWLDVVSEMDALFSLAGFSYNHPSFTYPEVTAEQRGFLAKNLGHPMIPQEKRVDNSLEITKEKVVLITGANMAGKSTFLRSVGVNMVLSYAGCPVCGDQFVTGPYQLFSSMRTADSLKDEESYFLAEIKRLKRIVDKMEDGTPMLILLDEVLKGTNTTDKQKGSRGLIEKSITHDILCFIATHDLALGDMQDQSKGAIVNYCFESYIKDLELTFDYKIQTGIAKNMNASFLMKKMGIMK